MRVPLSWLKEFVNFDLTGEQLAQGLTQLGLEVEQVMKPGGEAAGLVIGRLLTAEAHPEADNLYVCKVDVGAEQLTIVTGAGNVQADLWVVVAPPGSRLPDGTEMGSRKLRGILSEGMMCAAWELGLPSDAKTEAEKMAQGLLILPDSPELRPGLDALPILGLDDEVLELSLTPNYALHCQSIYGIAREIGAWLELPVALPSLPKFNEAESPDNPLPPAADLTSVDIAEPAGCPRYIARVIKGVKVGPSPLLVQRRLQLCGMRPINNVVDATNYVLLETGQPLHAFDLDQLAEQRIVVRSARPGETILTLDGEERRLTPDDLVIADGKRPQAIAGIMGGGLSEVGDNTADLLLEAATFAPRTVFRTSRRLGLRTEASIRFDKGVDPQGVDAASRRTADLIVALAGGQIAPGAVDQGEAPAPRTISFRPDKVRRLLLSRQDLADGVGPALDDRRIIGYLGRLGFSLTDAGEKAAASESSARYTVAVPSYRADVTGEADLAEEVGRLLGYDQLPAALPVSVLQASGRTRRQRSRLALRRALTAAGFDEVVTWSFTSPNLAQRLQLAADHPQHRALTIANPMVQEHSRLRTTLLGGLLDTAAYNLRHGNADLALFEASKIYLPTADGELPREQLTLGLLARGRRQRGYWQGAGEALDFFAVKGVLEHVAARLGADFAAVAAQLPFLRPGQSARLEWDEKTIGWLGRLHPDVAAQWDLPEDVVVAEVDLEPWLAAGFQLPRYEPLPRYPAVQRDISLVADKDLPADRIARFIRRQAGPLLADLSLFDVYAGDQVPAGQRSLTFSLHYRSATGTLTDDEVDEVHNALRTALKDELGAVLREGGL